MVTIRKSSRLYGDQAQSIRIDGDKSFFLPSKEISPAIHTKCHVDWMLCSNIYINKEQ
jgi:hypothetical protein